MTFTEILLALKVLGEAMNFLAGLAATLAKEGRDPTPEEVAAVKARQAAAEDAWKQMLPK